MSSLTIVRWDIRVPITITPSSLLYYSISSFPLAYIPSSGEEIGISIFGGDTEMGNRVPMTVNTPF
jgi:hypothetical protein